MAEKLDKIRKAEAQKEAAKLREELEASSSESSKDTVPDSSAEDVDHLIVVYEEGAEKPYKLAHSDLFFDVDIEEDGSLYLKSGKLKTNYLIRNTDVTRLETWRYVLTGVKLTGFHVDAGNDTLEYTFTADDFMDQTILADEADG